LTLAGEVYLAALEADSAALAELAADRLDDPVAACPGWSIADLLGHLGGVYSWASMVVRAGGSRPEQQRAKPPSDRAQLMSWFGHQREAVLSALTAADPDQPAWVFYPPSPRTVTWWQRRQAMETAVHLFDVQQAAGREPTTGPELAADGIDELLTDFLPMRLTMGPVSGLSGTFHVHTTDAPGEWLLDFTGQTIEVRREHAKGDTAARGPAVGLYLWLWNRLEPETAGIEVFGDASLVKTWKEVRI
jgi:uncharacterized protein (TIGR03083 family)